MEKDRSWMYGRRDTEEFLNGVSEFCKSALISQAKSGRDKFYCPCVDCNNVKIISSIEVIREHVLRRGFKPFYYVWVWHGEASVDSSVTLPQDMKSIKETLRDHLRHEMENKFAIMLPYLGIQEETPCKLLYTGSCTIDKLRVVAEGNAQPPSERLQVHFQSIPMGYFAIEVYKVHDGFEDLTVFGPSKDSKILKLRDAIGSLILWPRARLRISDETLQKTKAPKRKKTDTQASNIAPQLRDLNKQRNQKTEIIKGLEKTLLVGVNVLGSLSKACNWLHLNVYGLPDGKPIEVDLNKSFCNSPEDAKTWISKADVSLFLSGDMVNIPIMQAFVRSLQEHLNGCDCQIGWLCPEQISGSNCWTNVWKVRDYIDNGIKESIRAGDKFIFAPYIENAHWSLLVICVTSHTIYQFDSMRQVPPRFIVVKTPLNSVLKKINYKGLNKNVVPQWKSMECEQQEISIECGYYVMRFMYELATNCKEAEDLEKGWSINLPKVCISEVVSNKVGGSGKYIIQMEANVHVFKILWESPIVPFSKEDIHKVRDIWATYH